MRFLILSDLHSNLEALTAVLAQAKRKRFDHVLCLGDVVGYGGNPNEVVEILRGLDPRAVVRGNHDKVVSGLEDGEDFSEIARAAAMWTRGVLSKENREYLERLPQGPLEIDGFLLSHGTPLNEDDYLLSDEDADEIFEAMDFPLAFFGHSHFACAFSRNGEGQTELRMLEGKDRVLKPDEGGRYLVNPGSIGQPRDHDPRAAYALYDTQRRRIEVNRVAYDVASAQRRIQEEGLPEELAMRLEFGI